MRKELTRGEQLLGINIITIILLIFGVFVHPLFILGQIGWCATIWKMKAGMVVQWLWGYMFVAYHWIKVKIEDM